MARNIEIKARVGNFGDLLLRAAALADEGPFELLQDDTFFVCRNGRLKLRVFADGTGELIFYQRADQAGPKESCYVRSPTADPVSLCQGLTLAYGAAGRVVKHRTLFLAGRTRIHLDRVDGLGDFLELEVVLRDEEPAAAGVQEAEALLRRLEVDQDSLLPAAYVDLLQQAS